MDMRTASRRTFIVALWGGATAAGLAFAGGSPENVLLIIDPSNPDALHIGNYYRSVRNIPDRNVVYMRPGAVDIATFAAENRAALLGTLAHAQLETHIDYVVIAPTNDYFVSIPTGTVYGTGCEDIGAPVRRISISGAYYLIHRLDEVLAGALNVEAGNGYYTALTDIRAFNGQVTWLGGFPSTSANARRYVLAALLGYTGSQGNTVEQLRTMIDRSNAADGALPSGTYYFMNNTADPDRNVRAAAGQYTTAAASINNNGGLAQILTGTLPTGQHDALGIMTGAASLNIVSGNFTLLLGAFCEHLTSFAARFDTTSQSKVSAWITKGASGSWGAVEEPCNYLGKFPHARMHYLYFRGLSLGEAVYRTVQFLPFQMLLYGDPVTRPFGRLPNVAVAGLPATPASGFLTLIPAATSPDLGAQITQFDLFIDGVLTATVPPGGNFELDTRELSDGFHDVRVLAYDNRLWRSTGRWLGSLWVDNRSRGVTVTGPSNGALTTALTFDLVSTGTTPRELRLVHNGRVLAAAPETSTATFTVYGHTLGAGPSQVFGEAYYVDGTTVRSLPQPVAVSATVSAPVATGPVAFGYTRRVAVTAPLILELPAAYDRPPGTLVYTLLSVPAQADVVDTHSGPFRLVRPQAGARGRDTLDFRVTDPTTGAFADATIVLDYGLRPGDMNCDGLVNFADISGFIAAIKAGGPEGWPIDCPWLHGDMNGDGLVNFADISGFIAALKGQP